MSPTDLSNLRVARDSTEVLKFYAAKPRKTPTKFSLSYSGRRLRQCSARTRGWAGEATPRLQYRYQERMSRKVRELIAELENHGFVNRGGKGSHRNFTHPRVARPVTISGNAGDDAKKYQEKAVKSAIAEATR